MAARLGASVDEAAAHLRAGRLVAIPTETVYGLAGNALDESVVLSIYRVKNRPTFDPLILHTDTAQRLAQWVEGIPPPLDLLAERFWPGPLTLLLPKRAVISDLVTAGLPTVAVRIPAHDAARALLARLDFPLAAPSANPFGYISPTQPQHVLAQLGDAIDYVLDGGPCRVGVESTIVGLDAGGAPVIVRQGGISIEEIATVCPGIRLAAPSALPRAPGELPSHYAPRTPMVLLPTGSPPPQDVADRAALIFWKPEERFVDGPRRFVLAPDGLLETGARNLYRVLREADACGARIIYAYPAPEEGLGRAINDRLRRASNG
ncbi:MAG: threonylcarbamoyl-AMP synthase [Spirochaetes bacterium]|nr:threonylcarbamoyl-AMP synthase [Spirochaetota bacterium]